MYEYRTVVLQLCLSILWAREAKSVSCEHSHKQFFVHCEHGFTLKHAAVLGYPFFLGSGLLQISVPGVPNLTR
jgi:hypothetical protein